MSNGEDDYAADIRSIDYGEGKSPQNVFARAMSARRPALWGILDRSESHPHIAAANRRASTPLRAIYQGLQRKVLQGQPGEFSRLAAIEDGGYLATGVFPGNGLHLT